MDFSKKKYIIFKKEFPDRNVPLHSVYIGQLYKRISDWGFVRLQNEQVSEVVEFEKFFCYIPEFFYDEFSRFYCGKRPLLVEKYNKRSGKKDILIERNGDVDRVYVPLDIKVEKIIMSNGNSYITIS